MARMMKIVISGGGMVGMTLAHLLRRRGFEPVVVERMREGEYVPRGYMMGFQGFPPLEEIGALDEIRAAGWDIAPREDGSTVAIAVNIQKVLSTLARDLPVMYEHSVVGLLKDAEGRVVGVEVEGPEGRSTVESDLVVACDGVMSPVRQMAGLEANVTELSDASLTFMSPEPVGVSFKMEYFADGGHIGLLGWPEGSAGWRSVDKIGAEKALAPGLDAIKKMWIALIPESEPGVSALTSMDQIRYGEPRIMSCPRWWTPGVVIIGDSAHFFGPETGVSSGLGLGDAHALAQAVMQNGDDPDAACASYETWRAPVIRPYEATDPGLSRMMGASGAPRPEEMWPPPSD
jgi:2-polyprenyl-6-methoxyphenol hydroxylase-like FAD-dependent oxidoreductase